MAINWSSVGFFRMLLQLLRTTVLGFIVISTLVSRKSLSLHNLHSNECQHDIVISYLILNFQNLSIEVAHISAHLKFFCPW